MKNGANFHFNIVYYVNIWLDHNTTIDQILTKKIIQSHCNS